MLSWQKNLKDLISCKLSDKLEHAVAYHTVGRLDTSPTKARQSCACKGVGKRRGRVRWWAWRERVLGETPGIGKDWGSSVKPNAMGTPWNL